jgi:hypothetical protein
MIVAAAPRVHAQEPDPTIVDAANDPISVRIELITDTLSKTEQADVADQFRQQYAPLSRQHGLYDEAEQPVLVFRFEFGELDKAASVYVVHAQASYLGEVLHRDDARTCVNCTPADLVSEALRIVPLAANEVVERRTQALMAVAETAPATAEPPPSAPEGAEPTPRARVIGPVGYVGIASSVLGFGSGVAGIFVLDRGVQPDADNYGLTVTNYRPAGKALLGAGLGLLVVGNVLLAVDLAVLTPRRRAHVHAKVDGLSITVADHSTGVAVRGRF